MPEINPKRGPRDEGTLTQVQVRGSRANETCVWSRPARVSEASPLRELSREVEAGT